MTFPNFNEEKKLWQKGYQVVVGLDEAGRGPLAGPVIAAAITFRQIPNHNDQFPKVNDSKKLSARQREEFYKILINHKDVVWGVGIVSEKIIDKINILEATKLAMQRAIKKMPADFLLLDGNFTLRWAQGKRSIPQKSIIKGDQKVFSISCASIIAKVTRDKIMQKMHKKYPEYGFDKHKGYGTAVHLKNLKTHGACEIHRKSFYPISGLAKN